MTVELEVAVITIPLLFLALKLNAALKLITLSEISLSLSYSS